MASVSACCMAADSVLSRMELSRGVYKDISSRMGSWDFTIPGIVESSLSVSTKRSSTRACFALASVSLIVRWRVSSLNLGKEFVQVQGGDGSETLAVLGENLNADAV